MGLFHSYLPWGAVLVVEGAYLRGAYRRNATRGVRCRWWQAVATGAGCALQPGAYGRALHAGAKGRALHAGALTRALPEAPRSFNMASSSSSNHYDVAYGPLEDDLLWMQKSHISQHIWNGANQRTLKIRRATPLYNHREAPPEEIIPLLQVSGLYPIMKLAQLKINGALVNAFIERWRPETHTFHLKCGEATITLQDVFVLLGISMDGRPLTGNTNIDWFELCHELLGVMPDDDAVDGNSLLFSWLTSQFANINDFIGNQQGLERFARAWILRFIGGVMFVDKSSKRVPMRYLQFLRDLRECSTYAWGAALLGNLYREMCIATDYHAKSIGGFTLLIQLWAWERCPTIGGFTNLIIRSWRMILHVFQP
ncbi:serine/threonine-protein phosphatase 7 long form homolog [Glycine soja]|uniref:serine/threonine-protein phosphatase 7 long form homolog n=1 Tax=Glycine soja TaxID=3848 RepID=UPI00103E4275|nr:serine/threonine-protein phosphatase 7 long form homolog [Glycine soja]